MDYASEPSSVLAVAGTFLALCPIFAGLRFYTRSQQKSGLGIDDWLILPATAMVVGCAVSLIVGVKLKVYGYPTPSAWKEADASDRSFTIVEQIEWGFFLMQILSMGFIKLSFVFFCRRIFSTGHNPTFRAISGVVAAIITCWATAFFLWFLFSCPGNMAARWTTERTLSNSCPTDDMSDLALAISDFLTDVMILVLPIPMVLRLHMETSRKLIVLAVFGLGIVALVASIIRLALFVYLIEISEGILANPGIDPVLNVTKGLYWSMLESGLSFIACCLPTLNALFHLPGLRSVIRSAKSIYQLGSHGESSRKSEEVDSKRDLRFMDSISHDRSIVQSSIEKIDREIDISAKGAYVTETCQEIYIDPSIPENGIRVTHTLEQKQSSI